MNFYSIKEKLLFYYLPTTLFSLIPIFLITGPFLTDLSVSLISILFLIYCAKEKSYIHFKNKYFYFFLFFCFYLVLNSLINNFNSDSLKISIFYFRYGVFVLAIIALLNVIQIFVKYFFYCIFFCFIILILDGYYQYFVGENITGYKLPVENRVSSFFYGEMILGSYLSRLWPIFFGLSLTLLNKKNKMFYLLILIFVLSETLIFLSGDRSAFFYINLSAIFVILFSKNLKKLRMTTLFLSLFLILLISLINPNAKERVIDKTLYQMNLVDEEKRSQEGIYIFSKQHTSHYKTAYKMFLENKILGVGVKNFRIFCNDEKFKINKFSCSTHPHNTYIQILSETGIIGFLVLMTVFFTFCKVVLKHLFLKFRGINYLDDFKICILSGVLIFLWPLAPTGNVFNNWLNVIMLLNLPFLFSNLRIEKN